MSEKDALPQNVVDVLSLSTALAEQILQARSTGGSLSVHQFEAVVKAAEFLHEHNVHWPAIVTEVIDILVAQMEAIRSTSSVTSNNI